MTEWRSAGTAAKRLGLVSLLVLACAGACEGGGTDSNTNWLEPCAVDDDCGALRCVCAQCTKPCASSAECADLDGASCRANGARPGSCGAPGKACVKTCSTDDDCDRAGLACVDGYCGGKSGGMPDATAGDGGAAGAGAGGASMGAGGAPAAGRDAGQGGVVGVPDAAPGSSGPGGRDTGGLVDAGPGDSSTGLDGGNDASISSVQRNPLEFSFPTAHSMTDADGIRVAGIVDSVADVVAVTVNSVAAESLEGSFARWRTVADVPLAAGKNEIHVVAERATGAPLTLTGIVWREPASTIDHLVPAAFGSPGLPPSYLPSSLGWDRRTGNWVAPDYDGSTGLGEGLSTLDAAGVWAVRQLQGFVDGEPYGYDPPLTQSSLVVGADGNIYATDVYAFVGSFPDGPPPGPNASLWKIAQSVDQPQRDDGQILWTGPFAGQGQFRFAVDTARSRVLAVRQDPQVGFVGIDNVTGEATVLSDAAHGTGPLPAPGAPVVLTDDGHVLVPGCEGAMVVDLATGNRRIWGAASARACVVAEGSFDGKVVVLEQAPPAADGGAPAPRWQVGLLDAVEEKLTALFELEVEGTLVSATVDPDGARLAVVMQNPFALETYDLPGGRGPLALTFGAGPNFGLFRDFSYGTAVRHDGSLLVLQGGFSVDPDTGVRRYLTLPKNGVVNFDSGFWGATLPDPLTGDWLAATAEGVFRVTPDFASATRVGDPVEGPIAYDAITKTLYVVTMDGVQVLDTPTGSSKLVPASSDYTNAVNCGRMDVSVTGDHDSVSFSSGLGSPGAFPPPGAQCGCFRVQISTGAVSTWPCTSDRTRDGRELAGNADEIDVYDPVAQSSTVFSRAPDHGRGFPIPAGAKSSLVVDPRRDRVWLSTVYAEDPPTPQRFFVIDPFNGDRALVSD